jgi:hypothetical protein
MWMTNDEESGFKKITALDLRGRKITNPSGCRSGGAGRLSEVCIFLISDVKNHRWARLAKQQSSITVNRLLSKKNKPSFSISVCGKRNFCFTFAANTQKLQFSVRSAFCIFI